MDLGKHNQLGSVGVHENRAYDFVPLSPNCLSTGSHLQDSELYALQSPKTQLYHFMQRFCYKKMQDDREEVAGTVLRELCLNLSLHILCYDLHMKCCHSVKI